jgi:hypothetical protein
MTTTTASTRRALTVAAIGLGLGLALTACSGSSTGSGSGSGSTAGSSAGGSGSDAAGTGSSASGKTGSTCAQGQITVSAGKKHTASGHVSAPLLFRNTAHTACTLSGFPGVAGLDAKGGQVLQAKQVTHGYLDTSTITTVTVAPGATVSALVVGVNVPNSDLTSCPSYPELLVTPPGSHTSTKVKLSMPGCPTLQVSPIVRGSKGGL